MAEGELRRYAKELAHCLERGFGLTVRDDFVRQFVFHAHRLRPSEYEDLGSLVLLECHEQLLAEKTIDSAELKRIIDRVQHRLSRATSRERTVDPLNLDWVPARFVRGDSCTPDLDDLLSTLQQLSALHVLLFEMHYVQGCPVQQICEELRISPATVYRRLEDIREAAASWSGRNRL
jgi:hypothetical protein